MTMATIRASEFSKPNPWPTNFDEKPWQFEDKRQNPILDFHLFINYN